MHQRNKEYETYFKTFNNIELPEPLRLAAWLLVLAIMLSAAFLTFTPWVQTSGGTGTITALYPEDRVQAINALVAGRIGRWYVTDGSKVKEGDPIVEIIDNDPDLVSRLMAERDAVAAKLRATESAVKTAQIDYRRQEELFEAGLSSRRDFEQASIKVEQLKSTVESAKAELNQAEVQLSRQNTQLIRAPRDGTVLSINAGDFATFVSVGDVLATFFPENVQLSVELFINGLDAPLIYPGREVRLIFEGWPAVQFSGWPSMSVGTFKGKVQIVDPALSANGRIRVMVVESDEESWPSSYFLRYGARARGWVLLDQVPLGYELWRQLNNFPPEFSQQAEKAARVQWGTY